MRKRLSGSIRCRAFARLDVRYSVCHPRCSPGSHCEFFTNNDFVNWMNRPLQRVHVFTWKVACDLNPNNHPPCIRLFPNQREEDVKIWRGVVSKAVRRARQHSKIQIPIYKDQLQEYVF